jgi:hypothetical protein
VAAVAAGLVDLAAGAAAAGEQAEAGEEEHRCVIENENWRSLLAV